MWIKTDDGKWCNLDHYCYLQAGSDVSCEWALYGNLVGRDGVSCIYTTFAECKDLPEAQRILANIFYCLKRGDAVVDVADLRDVDLEKQDSKDRMRLSETVQDIADKIARSPDFVKQIEEIILSRARQGMI